MKRFYKTVSTLNAKGAGYHILLDGKPIKTKSGKPLSAENEAIANIIMQEWAAQKGTINPDSMPFMQLLSTKIDRVSTERKTMSAEILKYLDTDLLCYRAAHPPALVDLQNTKWQPWLDWFAKTYAAKLATTTSLSALHHPDSVHKAVSEKVESLDDSQFTALQLATAISGSIILALALIEGKAGARDVLDAYFLEEDYKDSLYNAEKHGPDPLIAGRKKSALQDLEACALYIALL